ncbi:MAG: hypothetical protein QXU40_02595 [Candidatus Pacearchaeota archaeon]
MSEKIKESIENAEKIIRTADHIVYITFPLVRDKRLLLKVIKEIKEAIIICLNSILSYESTKNKVPLYKDFRDNLEMFKEEYAINYRMTSTEISSILELLDFVKFHEESQFEFMKKDSIVIMSGGFDSKVLTLNQVKEFLILGKSVLKKTKEGLFRKV